MPIPARYERFVFGFFVSLIMSGVITGVVMLRTFGLEAETFGRWLHAWGQSWLVAYPTVLLVAPLARRLTKALCG